MAFVNFDNTFQHYLLLRLLLPMRIYFYCIILFLFAFQATAQKLSNVRASLDSTTVTILYNLESSIEGQLYNVELYSSHNDYSSPLLYVSGDVGKAIKPGIDKRIVWQTKELINFDGQLSFDVRAVLTFSPFIIKSPPQTASYKRGKNYTIEWAGGIPDEKIKLELFQADAKVNDIVLLDNKGNYQWIIPSKMKPSNKYQIKVSSNGQQENSRLSSSFKIRRRVPLLAKAIPVFLIGTGAYFILNQGSKTGEEDPEKNWLPAPDIPGK